MLEAARAMARSQAGTHVLTAGTPLRHALERGISARSPAVELPGADAPQAMQIEMAGQRSLDAAGERRAGQAGGQPLAGDGQPAPAGRAQAAARPDEPAESMVLTFHDTRRAGVYRLTWQATPGGGASDLYAVQPDPRESELRPIAEEELKALFGGSERVEVITPQPGAPLLLAVQGKEIWRGLATGLLVLLLVESGLATWAGRQR
jgi:hypothetical protein